MFMRYCCIEGSQLWQMWTNLCSIFGQGVYMRECVLCLRHHLELNKASRHGHVRQTVRRCLDINAPVKVY